MTIAIKRLRRCIGLGALSATLLSPAILQAQVLEEVVVTAQRRVQTLQEVPISIETMTGDEIREQGFRNMEDIAAFSPSVTIQSGVQDQAVSIRGVGTIGNSLTLEQAVPIFLDGIHYGRQSQIKTAFLDVDRVEVLKGPQPVFFGQNASAGAFNIISKGPTAEWEGNVDMEYGNNSTYELSFGVGGPISDTLGIRIAAAREESAGFLEHAITGEKLPQYDYLGGRVTLEWTPTDNFRATTKLDLSRLRNGSEAELGCLTGDSLVFGRQGPDRPAPIGLNGVVQGDERSVWADPPIGVGWTTNFTPISTECFKGNIGLSNQGPYYPAPDNVYEENSNSGSVEIRRAAEAFTSQELDGDMFAFGADSNGILGKDHTDAWSAMMNLGYTFDSGIELESISGYNSYWRNAVKDNAHSPFFMNYQGREENFRQWSTELRLSSDVGGTIEWMAAVSWQGNAKDNWSSSLRPNVRRGQRFNWLWEDVELYNAFATLTFNFMDDRASLDVGARYSYVEKDVFVVGYGATWVFDERPSSRMNGAVQLDPSAVRFLGVDQANVDLNNLWTYPYLVNRVTPAEWYPSTGVQAVGLTQPDFRARTLDEGGPHYDAFTDDFIDPQVTLRYRIGNDHSLFGRWARASKGAGYDTGQTSVPDTVQDMKFEAERGETFEIGSKGNLWDGRARYDVTLFRTDFTDLQLSGLAPITDQDSTSISLNAGKQRVEGVEFSLTALLTDQWMVNLSGAVMDGKMVEFAGSGCNQTEFWNAELGLNTPGVLPCDLDNGELVDRSGTQAPRTPDWKFVLTTNYTMPVLDNYELSFNAKGYISDGYINARDSFTQVVMYNRHGDLNLNVGIGDQAGVWKLSAYANNIFEARESYNREFDLQPVGLQTSQVNRSSFMTYGLRFGYNFR